MILETISMIKIRFERNKCPYSRPPPQLSLVDMLRKVGELT